MADVPSYCIVITTTATREDAEAIAHHLLAERLAACVQVSAIERTSLYEKVEEAIRAHHKYEVPEIIQLPIMAGAPSYLKWIDETTE